MELVSIEKSKIGRYGISNAKRMKAAVREIAKQQGQSFNDYVCEAIKEKAQQDTGEEYITG